MGWFSGGGEEGQVKWWVKICWFRFWGCGTFGDARSWRRDEEGQLQGSGA